MSEPIIMTPDWLITVCPSGSVNVIPFGPLCEADFVDESDDESGPCDVLDGSAGDIVKVSPSVLIVVADKSPVGSVMVSLPIIRIPELEITVCPSGSVKVAPPPARVVGVVRRVVGGPKVNVSPSVVIVVGAVRDDGMVRVWVPTRRTPELEITT